MSNQMLGAFGPYTSEINPEAKAAFADAMEHFVGVKYSPVAVASQVVSGINYSFFCNAEVVVPSSTVYPAMVDVYKPLNGPAQLTHIGKLNR
ncbi:hypothetical protein [Shewanella sp.]|uniref:hypothetical protein n=1 Tax=Shewanella sp. TaxID=50422 RepID=UPI004053B26C